MDKKKNMVSIWCITYNHAPYIRQCLDGFIMQKTNFPFVALVHDDASTDGTADIIREYAKLYPKIIHPIFQTENQYSKGFKEPQRLKTELCLKTKYVAYCDGDDYWVDPYKLQKQFDWMESHPDYSACFHQATIHYETGERPDEPCCDIENRDYTGLELYKQEHRPPSASIFFKSRIYNCPVYKTYLNSNFSFGDIPLFLCCAHEGKVRGMIDNMSVYRKHPLGATYTYSIGSKRMLRFADDHLKLYKLFGKEYKRECIRVYVIDYINYFFINIHQGRYHWGCLLKVLIKHPVTTLHFLNERWGAHRHRVNN